jgi:hypothetical protein
MKFIVMVKQYGLYCGFALLFGLGFQSGACAVQVAQADVHQTATASRQQVKTVVYYFHGNMRCSSCKKIEAYTEEAIRSGFPEALKNGTLELKVVNVEDPGNDHYVEDFQLYTRSVVVEKRLGNKQDQWKNLVRVWSLVRNKSAFMEYVQRETLALMKGA